MQVICMRWKPLSPMTARKCVKDHRERNRGRRAGDFPPYKKHIKRLTNQQCNTEAGVVFLDSLVCLERISDHARNIAEEVLAE